MADAGKIIVSLTCPACGGQVESEEGEELVICKFCNSAFALTTDEGIGKVIYRLDVSRESAEKTLKAWMGKGPKAKDLNAKSTLSEAFPIYLPFWRLTGRGKACVCGVEIHKDDKDNSETRVPYESLINREYIYTDAACTTGELGINTVWIPNDATATQLEDDAIVTFGVTESRDDAYAAGAEAIKREAIRDGKGSMDEINFAKAFFFPKAFLLVYYPFWILRYTYQDRAYFATVDGVTGEIVSGRAPGDSGSQSTAAALGGTLSGSALGLGIYLGLFFGEVEVIAAGFICGIIAAAIIIAISYKRFRYGDEIIEGNLDGKGLKKGKNLKSIQTIYDESYNCYR